MQNFQATYHSNRALARITQHDIDGINLLKLTYHVYDHDKQGTIKQPFTVASLKETKCMNGAV